MLKHRPIQNLYDFELEAGIAKHCLWVKIVDIAKIKFNTGFVFYGKGVLPVCTCARAPCTPPPSNIRY